MPASSEFRNHLVDRGRESGIQIAAEIVARLETYFQLLAVWNQKINLTSLPLTEPTADTIDRLLVEPLIAASYVRPSARLMLDVGSGGGSPAIPLAISASQLRLRMLESRTRKSVFLREAARAVGLQDAEVVVNRLKDAAALTAFKAAHDLVTVRAVRLDQQTLEQIRGCLALEGQVFLFGSHDADLNHLSSAGLRRVSSHPLGKAERGLNILQAT